MLLPLSSGQDFRVWELASAATLRGVDIYAHHPNYPGGPYAYLPLFDWVELPFQWLHQVTGLSFRVLGKVPVLVADVALGLLVRRELTERRCSDRVVLAATAVVLFDPLVLYNSAYYGRFDAVAVALLFAATREVRRRGAVSWRAAWLLAFAVAAKTFPAVAVPGFLRRGAPGARRSVIALVATAAVLLAPYWRSLRAVVHDVVYYDATKVPQGLSWQLLLRPLGDDVAKQLSLAVLAVGLVVICLQRPTADPHRDALVALLVFVLASKVVLEQYLTWPLPFLLVAAATSTGRLRAASAGLVALLTTVGVLVNADVHPFGVAPRWVAVLLAAGIVAWLVVAARDRSGTDAPDPGTDAMTPGPPGPRETHP